MPVASRGNRPACSMGTANGGVVSSRRRSCSLAVARGLFRANIVSGMAFSSSLPFGLHDIASPVTVRPARCTVLTIYQEIGERVNRHLISKQAQKEGRPCMPPLRIIRLHFLPRLEVFIVIVEREGHGAISHSDLQPSGRSRYLFSSEPARPAALLFHGRRP